MPRLAPALTETQILNLVPRMTRFKIGDGHGLSILVEPSGIKRWQYKYKRGAKETTFRLGSYPQLSLAGARQERDGAQKLIAAGIDPIEQRREQRKQEQADRPTTVKFILSTNEQGGLTIENTNCRMTLNAAQVAALSAFLIATTGSSAGK